MLQQDPATSSDSCSRGSKTARNWSACPATSPLLLPTLPPLEIGITGAARPSRQTPQPPPRSQVGPAAPASRADESSQQATSPERGGACRSSSCWQLAAARAHAVDLSVLQLGSWQWAPTCSCSQSRGSIKREVGVRHARKHAPAACADADHVVTSPRPPSRSRGLDSAVSTCSQSRHHGIASLHHLSSSNATGIDFVPMQWGHWGLENGSLPIVPPGATVSGPQFSPVQRSSATQASLRGCSCACSARMPRQRCTAWPAPSSSPAGAAGLQRAQLCDPGQPPAQGGG